MQHYNVIFIGDQWDDRWLRRKQIAHRLAHRPEVAHLVYVEFPLPLSSLLKYLAGDTKGDRDRLRWSEVLCHGLIRRVTQKITIVTPISLRYTFPIRAWQRAPVARLSEVLIRRASLAGKPHKTILWVGHPPLGDLIGCFPRAIVCYDCTERFHYYYETLSPAFKRTLVESDEQVTRRADLVFVQTEEHLVEKLALNPCTFLVPNGVDYELYARGKNQPMPVDMAMLPQPIIGYVGNINYRVDMDLIKWLAERNPGWSFVFVGSVKSDVDLARLSAYENLHFLGHRPYNDLPCYVHHFDVCLIPYRPLSEMGSPIKLYDYLACGKPVVTTKFAGVVGFSDVVYIAECYDDFEEMIETAISERQKAAECLAQARRQVAQSCSWDVRSEEVWNRIREVIERTDRRR